MRQKTEWILRQQEEWNHFPSMRWQQQKKHLKMPDLIWKKKIRSVSAVSIGSGIGSSEACEQHKKIDAGQRTVESESVLVPMMISNMAAGNVPFSLAAKGKCTECGNSLCDREHTASVMHSVPFSTVTQM